MTNSDHPIDEADLHAFVDGRLGDLRRAQVVQHLAANPALQRRVQDWQTQAAALRLALRPGDAQERAAIMGRLAARPLRSRPRWGQPSAIAASLVLCLALGGVGGWLAHGSRGPSEMRRLEMEATSAYRVFANDPSRAIEVSSSNRAELAGWLTEKLGRRVVLPDLAGSGYQLLGGRVLSALYGPAAMLLYSDAAGNRITVYVQPMAVGAPAPMRQVEAQSVDGYAWIERQVGYTVLSEGDHDRLHAMANQVRADSRL
jgi:anti-sigma factor RsiW